MTEFYTIMPGLKLLYAVSYSSINLISSFINKQISFYTRIAANILERSLVYLVLFSGFFISKSTGTPGNTYN